MNPHRQQCFYSVVAVLGYILLDTFADFLKSIFLMHNAFEKSQTQQNMIKPRVKASAP